VTNWVYTLRPSDPEDGGDRIIDIDIPPLYALDGMEKTPGNRLLHAGCRIQQRLPAHIVRQLLAEGSP